VALLWKTTFNLRHAMRLGHPSQGVACACQCVACACQCVGCACQCVACACQCVACACQCMILALLTVSIDAATSFNTLQQTATDHQFVDTQGINWRCNTLQYTATHCNTPSFWRYSEYQSKSWARALRRRTLLFCRGGQLHRCPIRWFASFRRFSSPECLCMCVCVFVCVW